MAPVDRNRPVPRDAWIAITDAAAIERSPVWSPEARLLYYLSERDGFRCVWARGWDAANKRPAGYPFAVLHFHSARRSPRAVGNADYLTGLSLARNSVVLALAESTGSIWIEETPRAK